jgi:hypothetical protein
VDDSSRLFWYVERQARPFSLYWENLYVKLLVAFHNKFEKAKQDFSAPVWYLAMTDTLAWFKCHKPVIRSYLDTCVTGTWKYQTIYWRTSWSRVLLENITGSQIVKKFLAFFGTRRFITTFTTARQLSLSWARSIQSLLPAHLTSWRYTLILYFHIRLGLPSYLENIRRPTYVEL